MTKAALRPGRIICHATSARHSFDYFCIISLQTKAALVRLCNFTEVPAEIADKYYRLTMNPSWEAETSEPHLFVDISRLIIKDARELYIALNNAIQPVAARVYKKDLDAITTLLKQSNTIAAIDKDRYINSI